MCILVTSHKSFPTYEMLVCGQEVEFLVGRFTHSISASGTVQRENFTIPLACIDEQG